MSRVSQMLKASSGEFTSSFVFAGVLLILGAVVALTLRAFENSQAAEEPNVLKQAA